MSGCDMVSYFFRLRVVGGKKERFFDEEIQLHVVQGALSSVITNMNIMTLIGAHFWAFAPKQANIGFSGLLGEVTMNHRFWELLS